VKLLLELSMECEPLARAEAIATARSLGRSAEVAQSEKGLLVIDADANPSALAERLGLCHYVSEWLGSTDHAHLDSLAEQIEVEGPIRVRATKIGGVDADLLGASGRVGKIIGRSGGVNLRSPKSDVRVVFSESVHIGKVIGAVDRSSYERRKNRHMPFVYPASLHPKFARALVNLTEVRAGGRILDPFCGTGAILAEAAMTGFDVIGSDIAQRMIDGSRKNLAHLGLRAHLEKCDVSEIGDRFGAVDGIATDPPYGKSTSTDGEELPSLYERAFKAFSGILGEGSRMALVVPDVRLIDEARDFELEQSHDLWVHRSLTRKFCVLRRR
jgi:tRNA (guanine10-N2)-dimethyltransferase